MWSWNLLFSFSFLKTILWTYFITVFTISLMVLLKIITEVWLFITGPIKKLTVKWPTKDQWFTGVILFTMLWVCYSNYLLLMIPIWELSTCFVSKSPNQLKTTYNWFCMIANSWNWEFFANLTSNHNQTSRIIFPTLTNNTSSRI